jgi:sugar phosphate isomerase/epimerase
MRLGGPVTCKYENPEEWITALKRLGYRAAYSPVDNDASASTIEEFVNAAKKAKIIIAEVGAWKNSISIDSNEREAAILYNQKQLELADRLGAQCCVNISGSRGKKWDGPSPDNLTDDTFTLIVDTVRCIIDAVKPVRTFYTLEPMPWAYPDSPDSYLKLIRAIDRKAFGVHMDIVNMINSPVIFLKNGQFIRECFQKLGPYIKSCHLKDITLSDNLTVHLDEAIPGTGGLDYKELLTEINKLDEDMPVMLEHLATDEEYEKAASFVLKTADELKFKI